MIEIALDKYQLVNIDAMILWCQRSLPVKTWTVHFTKDNTAIFEFSKSKYATHFLTTWQ